MASGPAQPQGLPAPCLAGASAVGAGAMLNMASPRYVLAGRPPARHDAAQFADEVFRTSAVAITTKLIDAVYVVDSDQRPAFLVCPTVLEASRV